MKIQCDCGRSIHDGTDDLSQKAHFIPDQEWNRLFDALDDLIENRCHTDSQRNATCTRIRSLIGQVARTAWQCTDCGKLFAEDETYQLHGYSPATPETAKELFRRNTT